MSSSSSSSSDESLSSNLPIKEIPGDLGLPIISPIKDRLDYFYRQGYDGYFRSRMLKNKSTVFRANMPRGYFIGNDPRVVVVLDSVSFSVLFDLSKVEKKNVLAGSYIPSLSYTGGYPPCAYIDPSDPNHAKLKGLFFSMLASRHHLFIPQFQTFSSILFDNLDDQINRKNGKADFTALSGDMIFNFLFQLFFGDNTPKDAQKIVTKWLFLQLSPFVTFGLPKVFNLLEDLLLHNIHFPMFLVKSDYQRLYDAIYSSSTSLLDEAEKMGIKRDDACHNLIFMASLNAFMGFKAFIPNLMKWVGLAGEKLHMQLVDEIRSVIESEGGQVTVSAIEKMKLTKSVVYEALRIEPPVPLQYGTAKKDLIIESHDAAFQVKKGELIMGYQTFATRDPKVFQNPEQFVADRFLGEEGEKLLKYVYWSNAPETEDPTVDNKQCPAKDLVLLVSRLLLVEFFLRYDTFTVDVEKVSMISEKIMLTSIKKKTA